MEVIKPEPKNAYYNDHHVKIFLAGSIEMGKAEDWQAVIPELFKDRQNLVFFNPRRDDWDSSWEQKESNPQFSGQVNWEMNKLDELAKLTLRYKSGLDSSIKKEVFSALNNPCLLDSAENYYQLSLLHVQ